MMITNTMFYKLKKNLQKQPQKVSLHQKNLKSSEAALHVFFLECRQLQKVMLRKHKRYNNLSADYKQKPYNSVNTGEVR